MVCFRTKNPKYGYILEGLWMVNVGLFYDHLEYCMAIWYNLWSFDIPSLWSFIIFFPNLECLDQEKSGHPAIYDELTSTTLTWCVKMFYRATDYVGKSLCRVFYETEQWTLNYALRLCCSILLPGFGLAIENWLNVNSYNGNSYNGSSYNGSSYNGKSFYGNSSHEPGRL
jgi:hypothetical protein